MGKITLKYDTNELTLYFTKLVTNVLLNKTSGDTLSGVKFEHVSNKRKQYDVTFFADSFINNVSLAYLYNFFSANNHFIKIENGSFIEVIINNNETIPISLLNEIELLKEVNFNFIEKVPTTIAFA